MVAAHDLLVVDVEAEALAERGDAPDTERLARPLDPVEAGVAEPPPARRMSATSYVADGSRRSISPAPVGSGGRGRRRARIKVIVGGVGHRRGGPHRAGVAADRGRLAARGAEP